MTDVFDRFCLDRNVTMFIIIWGVESLNLSFGMTVTAPWFIRKKDSWNVSQLHLEELFSGIRVVQ